MKLFMNQIFLLNYHMLETVKILRACKQNNHIDKLSVRDLNSIKK